jgi:hypothetical protein
LFDHYVVLFKRGLYPLHAGFLAMSELRLCKDLPRAATSNRNPPAERDTRPFAGPR